MEPDDLVEYFKKNGKIKSFSGQSAKVHCVAWNKTGSKLASGSYDKSVCIFNFNGEKLVCFIIGHFRVLLLVHVLER